jgi:hypothetical protein
VAEGFEKRFEVIDGVLIYRHPLPSDAAGTLAYVGEHATASWRVLLERGFDVMAHSDAMRMAGQG